MPASRAPAPAAASIAALDDALGVIVRAAHVPRLQEAVLADAGLAVNRAAYPVLRRLELAGAMRLTELAAALALDTSTISRHVKDLEARGLLTRAGDPADRRAAVLTLTAEGTRALAAVRAARHRLAARILAEWAPEDIERFAALCTSYADSLAALLEEE